MYKSISYVRVIRTFIKLIKVNNNLFELPNNNDLRYGASLQGLQHITTF